MKPITVDFVNETITMTRKFAEKATDPRTKEYEILQQTRRDYPYFTVRKHTIKKNPNKECYKGLTYEYMIDHIKTHETAENAEKVLAEFKEMKHISECHSKAFRYPTIKKWFLDKYPSVATFGIDLEEAETRKVAELAFPKLEDAVA